MNKALAAIALISAANAISVEGMKKTVSSVGAVGGKGKKNRSTDTSGTSSTDHTYSLSDGITEGVISQYITETVGSNFIVCVDPCADCEYPWVKVTTTYT